MLNFHFSPSSKYPCYYLCCMCSEADCAIVAAFFGFFLLRSLPFSFVFMHHARRLWSVRVFRDMMLDVCAIASCPCEGSCCLHLQGLSSPRSLTLGDEGTMILRNDGNHTQLHIFTFCAVRPRVWQYDKVF
jgi:hypothetical protein